MKSSINFLRITLIAAIALLIIGAFSFSDYGISAGEKSVGTELTWHDFDEGFARAKNENKLILVDVYTDWCHWCKLMDKNVYTNNAVVDYLTENYVAIKLNAESDDEITFQSKQFTKRQWSSAIGVTGYPTTVFLEPTGKPITSLPGYVEAPMFLDVIRYVASGLISKGIAFDAWQKKKKDAK